MGDVTSIGTQGGRCESWADKASPSSTDGERQGYRPSIPNALQLDAHLRYELAKLGLWRAVCKRNPQLALFDEVYGDSPDSPSEWVSYSTSGTQREPVHLIEPRQLTAGESGQAGQVKRTSDGLSPHSPEVSGNPSDGSGPQPASPAVSRWARQWCRTMLRQRDGIGATPPSTFPPGCTEGGSAPSTTDVDRPRPHDQGMARGRGQKETQ